MNHISFSENNNSGIIFDKYTQISKILRMFFLKILKTEILEQYFIFENNIS